MNKIILPGNYEVLSLFFKWKTVESCANSHIIDIGEKSIYKTKVLETNCRILPIFENNKFNISIFSPSLRKITQKLTLTKSCLQIICYLHCKINDNNIMMPKWFFEKIYNDLICYGCEIPIQLNNNTYLLPNDDFWRNLNSINFNNIKFIKSRNIIRYLLIFLGKNIYHSVYPTKIENVKQLCKTAHIAYKLISNGIKIYEIVNSFTKTKKSRYYIDKLYYINLSRKTVIRINKKYTVLI